MEDKSNKFYVIIPTVLTVIAAIISPFIYDYYTADEKRLEYSVITDSQLFDSKIIGTVDFDIVLDSLTIKNLFIKTIKVQNSGTVPIHPSDFQTPIKIKYEGNERIISVSTVYKYPEDISPEINLNGIIEVQPLLLNPRDNFTLQILSEKRIEEVNLSARILGITNVTKSTQDQNEETDIKLLITLALMIIGLTYTYGVVTVAIKDTVIDRKYSFVRKNDLSNIQMFTAVLFLLFTLVFLELIGIKATWVQITIFMIVLSVTTYIIKRNRLSDYDDINGSFN